LLVELSVVWVWVCVMVCPGGCCSESLCDLANLCASVSSSCGPKTNKELMGAFRALCMPSQGLKGSHAGYSCLTSRTSVSGGRGQEVEGSEG